MSGTSIGLNFNYGYAGGVSRTPDCVIESKPVKTGANNILFGAPVILDATNTFVDCGTTTITAANFAGVAVAEAKQLNSYAVGQDQTQNGYYAALQMCDVIERGIVAVKVVHGTVTAGGAVYVRKTLSTAFPLEKVGDFRADADGSNTVAITNCSWNTNLKDANNIAELKIKSINT